VSQTKILPQSIHAPIGDNFIIEVDGDEAEYPRRIILFKPINIVTTSSCDLQTSFQAAASCEGFRSCSLQPMYEVRGVQRFIYICPEDTNFQTQFGPRYFGTST